MLFETPVLDNDAQVPRERGMTTGQYTTKNVWPWRNNSNSIVGGMLTSTLDISTSKLLFRDSPILKLGLHLFMYKRIASL